MSRLVVGIAGLVGIGLGASGCGCPEVLASVDASGTTPIFSWQGGDGYQLVVTSTDRVHWSIQCNTGDGCFAPPLPYGEVREDVVEIVPAEVLERGDYQLTACTLCDGSVLCSERTPFSLD